METKPLTDLHEDPNNPRIMKDHDAIALQKSLDTFGDLAPIVFNRQTGQLVGGHQRIKLFARLNVNKDVFYTQRFDTPDEVGTVAWGFVRIGNKQFAYREVDWPEGKQRSANIAANRIQGDWHKDMLAQQLYELTQIESDLDLVNLTGLDEAEQTKLMQSIGVVDTPVADDGQGVEKVVLIVECDDDEQRQAIYTELLARGLSCKLGAQH